MNRPDRFGTLCVVAGLVFITAVGCGNDDDPALVTTTSQVVTTAAPTTTAPTLSTTTPSSTATGDSTANGTGSEQETESDVLVDNEIYYRVVRLEPTREGNLLYLEIPAGNYTDVDLENLVLSVYEERDDLYEVHIFDNPEAVKALLKGEGERTPEEAELLDRHYLVSLLEGSILRYQGPFANLEGFIIGS